MKTKIRDFIERTFLRRMRIFKILEISIKNLFKKPDTNLFPETPPISVPIDYRGMVGINNYLCNGCGFCNKVCPCGAIQLVKKERRARIWVGRCIFCGQCKDVCSKGAIFMTDDVLVNAYEKDSRRLIVE